MNRQLLCTFAHKHDLEVVIEYIKSIYEIPERRIFVFCNEDSVNDLYCTYNVDSNTERALNTISIHRKKETNTLYTVNALNEYIQHVNNGVLDKTFEVEWNRFHNSMMLTDNEGGYRIVDLVLFKKITW